MATWIAHLRIAENILKKYNFPVKAFLAGNLGPDCGMQSEDGYTFDPPKNITHWHKEDQIYAVKKDYLRIDSEAFYNQYICNAEDISKFENGKDAFLLGYYFHLLTDIEWSKMFTKQLSENPHWQERLDNDKAFIWTIKKDWYGLDFFYLEQLDKTSCINTFFSIDHMEDYLDYYPKGAIIHQLKYIQDFYESNSEHIEYLGLYLSKEQMDSFVDHTTEVILNMMKEKQINN